MRSSSCSLTAAFCRGYRAWKLRSCSSVCSWWMPNLCARGACTPMASLLRALSLSRAVAEGRAALALRRRSR
eukprot:19442-Heterococcus_DN1.PRE.2